MSELNKAKKAHEFIIQVNEKTKRIAANVVYEKVNKNYVGVYFGYEGGGVSSDGFFCLDSKFKGVVTKDETDIPGQFTENLYELQRIRAQFSDWDENEDGSQASAFAMQYQPDTEGSNWEHSSESFDSRVWSSLYHKWSLIV